MKRPFSPRFYQIEAHDAVMWRLAHQPECNPVVALPTGCHARGSRILMFDGSVKPVEDVIVGDQLMGPDSKPRTVLQLCGGRQEMRRVVPTRGEPFVVNKDHKLSLYITPAAAKPKYLSEGSKIETVTVDRFATGTKWFKHIRKLRRVAVEFLAAVPLPIDPYFVGAMLGDGSLADADVGFCASEPELISYMAEQAALLGCRTVVRNKPGTEAKHIRFVRTSGRTNPLRAVYSKLGLAGTRSNSVFIPQAYKVASRSARLELLAGLADTDGHLSHGVYEITSISEQLAKDIQFVSRSLGFQATLFDGDATLNGIFISKKYRVVISGDIDNIPVKIGYKKAAPRLQKKNPRVTGFTVENLPEDDYFGFTLTGDHLYLTDDFVVHHNSGKSPTIGMICKTVLSWRPHHRIMVMAHVKELLAQNFGAIRMVWPQAPVAIYSAGLKSKRSNMPITVGGIQSCVKNLNDFGKQDIIIIDEAQMLSPAETANYQKLINHFKAINPKLIVIGLSATPYRAKTGLLTDGEESIFTDIVYDITGRDAFVKLIELGYLIRLKSTPTKFYYDVSNVKSVGGDYNKGQLEDAVNTDEQTEKAITESLVRGIECSHWLVFCAGIKHIEAVAASYRRKNQSVVFVHSKMGEAERDEAIRAFKSGEVRIIVSDGILRVGFDSPFVDHLVLLCPTRSVVKHCLSLDTEILTPTGFKRWNELAVGDAVVGYDQETGEQLDTVVTGYVKRRLAHGENLYSYDSRQFRFCMTGDHNFLYEIRRGRKANRYWDRMKAPLKSVADTETNLRVIVSSESTNLTSCRYTEDELTLLGLYLSDGTFQDGTSLGRLWQKPLVFYQSERYPAVIAELESLLYKTGFTINKREITRKVGDGSFQTQFRSYAWTVYQKDGKRTGNLGWSSVYEESDFDKDLSQDLQNIGRSDLIALLRGINLGDGSKYACPSITWTPATMCIHTGRKKFADNLQMLCLRNGFACRIVQYESKLGSGPVYRIYIKDKTTETFKPTQFMHKVGDTSQEVWCVENETGNIITRYEGFVMITGNCQTLGRGTRPFYMPGYDLDDLEGRLAAIAASPKHFCLVSDFALNLDRMGPINDPVLPGRRKKSGGELAIKVCPECDCHNYPAARICEECGHEFEFKGTKLHDRADESAAVAEATTKQERDLLKEEPNLMWVRVNRVEYDILTPQGHGMTMRVAYHCTKKKKVTELVSIGSATGWQHAAAYRWWRDRLPGIDPPEDVITGMKLTHALKEPTHLLIDGKERYPKIRRTTFNGDLTLPEMHVVAGLQPTKD